MIYRNIKDTRSGASVIEFAIIAPITFIIIIVILTLGLGIFRYQECSYLARQAARYASVHGQQYAKDTGNKAATSQSIYDNAIKPGMVILDPNQLTYTVTYSDPKNVNSQYYATLVNNKDVFTNNTVTVTITYQWSAQPFFKNFITLQSTATMPMSY